MNGGWATTEDLQRTVLRRFLNGFEVYDPGPTDIRRPPRADTGPVPPSAAARVPRRHAPAATSDRGGEAGTGIGVGRAGPTDPRVPRVTPLTDASGRRSCCDRHPVPAL
ncbi:hypothetical protein GCM10010405_29720 [Streptomyces macrosporus]|uniref:Uncharacterized protein n=1 Tax=Streptomyces macrosporus TaxID=44032 RepID=A0ABN3JYJ3_9ACTN